LGIKVDFGPWMFIKTVKSIGINWILCIHWRVQWPNI